MKLREYQAVPSVRAYVIVESDAAAVTVLARDRDGDRFGATGLTEADRLDLAVIGVSVPVAELYAGIEFGTVATP